MGVPEEEKEKRGRKLILRNKGCKFLKSGEGNRHRDS